MARGAILAASGCLGFLYARDVGCALLCWFSDARNRPRFGACHDSVAESRLAQKCGKPLLAKVFGEWHLGGGRAGTEVLFAENGSEFTFLGEQFWGRAARASKTRKSLGRSLNLGPILIKGKAGRRDSRRLFFVWRSSVRRDHEVDGDVSLGLDGSTVLQVRLEAPLADCFASCLRQNRGSLYDLQVLNSAVPADQCVKHHRSLHLHLAG